MVNEGGKRVGAMFWGTGTSAAETASCLGRGAGQRGGPHRLRPGPGEGGLCSKPGYLFVEHLKARMAWPS